MRVSRRSKIEVNNSVWVDASKGSDSSGKYERRDRPFETINAAFNAIPLTDQGYTMYIANGTYTLTAALVRNANGRIRIECQSRDVIINQPIASSVLRTGGSVTSFMEWEVISGTWNRTGITANHMFTGQNDPDVSFIFKDANINDIGGTGAVFYERNVELVEWCRVISSVGNILVPSGHTGTTMATKFKNCYLHALAADIVTTGTLRPIQFENCRIITDTGRLITSNGNGVANFDFCQMDSFAIYMDCRALSMNMRNSSLTMTSNSPGFRMDTAAGANLCYFDNAVIRHPDGTTANAVDRSGGGIAKMVVGSGGLYYEENHVPPAGPVFSNAPIPPAYQPDGIPYPNGTIGARFSAFTNLNVVTFNLPAPYNTAPIIYNMGAGGAAVELAAMKAAIDAQIIIAGTPWNKMFQGDVDRIYIDSIDDIRFFPHPQSPGYYVISATTQYITNTGTDILQDLNVLPAGIVELMGGDQVAVPDVEITLNGSKFIDVMAGKVASPIYRRI